MKTLVCRCRTEPVPLHQSDVFIWFDRYNSAAAPSDPRFSFSCLVGTIHNSIGLLPQLYELSLHSNSISGNDLRCGCKRERKTLRGHSNSLLGTIPSTIGKLALLTTLYLFSNRLSGKVHSR